MKKDFNPFLLIVAFAGFVALFLSALMNSNRNWDMSRDKSIPDVRDRD